MTLIEIKYVICVSISLIFFLTSCQKQTNNLFTIEEILQAEEIRVPVWYLNLESDYNQWDVVYYYSGDYSEVTMDAYFTMEDEEGQTIRVARLSTFYLNGQLVDIDENKSGPNIPVYWAGDGDASLCKVLPKAYGRDKITGPSYQTCMFWLDEALYEYKLYTIWSEEETEPFINSLINVRKPSQ